MKIVQKIVYEQDKKGKYRIREACVQPHTITDSDKGKAEPTIYKACKLIITEIHNVFSRLKTCIDPQKREKVLVSRYNGD